MCINPPPVHESNNGELDQWRGGRGRWSLAVEAGSSVFTLITSAGRRSLPGLPHWLWIRREPGTSAGVVKLRPIGRFNKELKGFIDTFYDNFASVCFQLTRSSFPYFTMHLSLLWVGATSICCCSGLCQILQPIVFRQSSQASSPVFIQKLEDFELPRRFFMSSQNTNANESKIKKKKFL